MKRIIFFFFVVSSFTALGSLSEDFFEVDYVYLKDGFSETKFKVTSSKDGYNLIHNTDTSRLAAFKIPLLKRYFENVKDYKDTCNLKPACGKIYLTVKKEDEVITIEDCGVRSLNPRQLFEYLKLTNIEYKQHGDSLTKVKIKQKIVEGLENEFRGNWYIEGNLTENEVLWMRRDTLTSNSWLITDGQRLVSTRNDKIEKSRSPFFDDIKWWIKFDVDNTESISMIIRRSDYFNYLLDESLQVKGGLIFLQLELQSSFNDTYFWQIVEIK
jgi:hypothetical protein